MSRYMVGLSGQGEGKAAGHIAVEADDALVAALKVKQDNPQARITYVRRANARGDRRNPAPKRKS